MNLKWSQIRWANDRNGEPYLLLSVKGKTGKRDLVARSGTETYLKRAQARFPDLASLSFDELLKAKIDVPVFRMENGRLPYNFCNAFEEFLADTGILYDQHGDKRTLYSLRHMYATSRLMIDKVNIHTLAVQMGTSVTMIEKHYSHLTAQMAADVLAGPRHDPDKAIAAKAKKQIEQANAVALPVEKPSKKTKVVTTT
jgi:integrase